MHDGETRRCPFCELGDDQLIWSAGLVVAIRDRYPVSDGYPLVITRSHPSGLALIGPDLEDALNRGARVRVLTGDSLGTTNAAMLARLLARMVTFAYA